MKRLVLSGGVLIFCAVLSPAQSPTSSIAEQRALINRYCAGCHNDKIKSGGMTLSKLDLAHVDQNADLAEKVIRKVRAGLMPPAGLPRPDLTAMSAFAGGLEEQIDKAAASASKSWTAVPAPAQSI